MKKDEFWKQIRKVFFSISTMGMFKEYEQPLIDSDKDNFIRVAAGDPAQDGYLAEVEGNYPETIEYDKSFVVDGLSMSPEDIDNGDILGCQLVRWKTRNDFQTGKYVVIKVDKDYYKNRDKELRFRYKLRKTLSFVPAGYSADQLIEELKQTNDDILLSENQKRLKEKLEETRDYEAYKNKDLVLSITYRSGSLRYSFHPIGLIEYVGMKCFKMKDGKLIGKEI